MVTENTDRFQMLKNSEFSLRVKKTKKLQTRSMKSKSTSDVVDKENKLD